MSRDTKARGTHHHVKVEGLLQRGYTDLGKVRLVQRNLVYIIGLAPKIAQSEVTPLNTPQLDQKSQLLKTPAYLGQYGKIVKVIINSRGLKQRPGEEPSYAAYVTFSRALEAAMCILAIDKVKIENRTIKASLGTTKYCSYFQQGLSCKNAHCFYLHKLGPKEDEFLRVRPYSLPYQTLHRRTSTKKICFSTTRSSHSSTSTEAKRK